MPPKIAPTASFERLVSSFENTTTQAKTQLKHQVHSLSFILFQLEFCKVATWHQAPGWRGNFDKLPTSFEEEEEEELHLSEPPDPEHEGRCCPFKQDMLIPTWPCLVVAYDIIMRSARSPRDYH